jgi:hypothetical protein
MTWGYPQREIAIPPGQGIFPTPPLDQSPIAAAPAGRCSAINVEIRAELCHTKGERVEIGEKRMRPAFRTDLLDFQDDRPYGLWFALTRRAD